MKITGFALEKLEDPFGILSGERYECFLDIEVPEEDELFTENGLLVKVLYAVEEQETRMITYSLLENTTEKYLEFELEEDELTKIDKFCKEHLPTD